MIHDNCKEFQNLDKGLIKTRMRQNEQLQRDTKHEKRSTMDRETLQKRDAK